MQDLYEAASAALAHLPAALLHSLWQGVVVAALAYIALHAIPAKRANLRYGVSVLGLFTIVLALLATWAVLAAPEPAPAPVVLEAVARADVSALSPETPEAVAAPPTAIAATEESPAPTPMNDGMLVRWLMGLWLAGVAAMLLRVLWLMSGVRTLRRQSHPLDSPVIAGMLEELQSLLRVSRRVIVRVADDVATPIAMGLLWPTIILPASMATGLPPEQLRAILAHELAHIRRYDYLVNFFQLVIEALLYFNPAVWWLSRQIRIEREACCDAAAARALGDTLDYADALTRVSRYVHAGYAPSAAQAFGASAGEGMLERLRRLLSPGYRPRLRLRWYSVVAGTLLSVAILFGLYQSAALAQRLLTDEERIAAIEELRETYQPNYEELGDEKVPISGTIVTYDGKELPEDTGRLDVQIRAGNHSIHSSVHREGMQFHGDVAAGNLYIIGEFPGYAPTAMGPLEVKPGQPLSGLKLELAESHPATVRFVTPEGKPIEGMEVSGGHKYLKTSWSWSLHYTSDVNGEIQIEQAADPVPVSLRATAEGYQESEQNDMIPQPDQVFEWVMQPDVPVQGVVTDKDTGAPVVDADVASLFEPRRGFTAGPEGKTITTTDAQGRFTLRGLADGRRYYYLVHADGYGSELFVVEGGRETPVEVTLGKRYVRGVIRDDLSLLKRSKDGDTPIVEYSMEMNLPAEHHSHGDGAHEAPVEVVDGEGRFLLDELRAGELVIQAGPERVTVPVSDPVDDLVIRLTPPDGKPQRKVVIHLPVPEGAPPAEGELTVQPVMVNYSSEHTIAIHNGRAETTVTPPTKVTVRTKQLNGYIPKPVSDQGGPDSIRWGVQIPEGDDPFVIELPLERAGAIEGKVLRPDGSPAEGAYVYVRTESASSWPEDYLCEASANITCDEDGRFAVLPVPFGQTLLVSASINFARDEKRVEVSEKKPIATIELELPDGVDVPVLVVDPEGTPMPDMEVFVDYPGGGHSGLRTNSDGVFLLKGADPSKEYFVEAHPTETYQFERADIPFDGKQVVLRLRPGLKLHGVVQVEGTGKPIPNARVTARMAYDPSAREYRQYESETFTNAQGEFALTNLCDGTFRLHADAGQLGLTNVGIPEVQVDAGREEPVVIELRQEDAR